MANNINPININTNAVNYSQISQYEKKDGAVKDSEKKAQPQVDKKDVAASDVLNYMAAQNIDIQPAKVQRTLDVSKYVSKDQADRIAGFVQGFEAEVEKGLLNFNKEFPQAGVSDDVKMNLAVEMFNRNNMQNA
ncbi:MAG: hypothetical protein PHV37_00705 [Candidatus Gastranaerophilales bacterium]|nr:hypothetical protein [Candidatus Gastranaerophilales bacterium]